MANLNTDLISPEQAIEATVTAYNSKAAIEKIRGLEVSASEIDGVVVCHPQISAIKRKLIEANEDIKIFFNSDSTGESTDEWGYQFASWLVQEFPAYRLYWYMWNITTEEYNTPLEIGTGENRIDFFSYGIGGSRPDNIFSFWNKGVEAIIDLVKYPGTHATVDLIIMNHGHNLIYDRVEYILPKFSELMEELLQYFSGAGVVVVRQNPWMDNDESRYESRKAILEYSALRGFALSDVSKLFYDKNKDSSLYSDNVHPSKGMGTEETPTGTRLYVNAIQSLFNGNINPISSVNTSYLDNISTNLLRNGNFTDWANINSMPDLFLTGEGFTAAKDTSTYETRKNGVGYSLKVVTTGGGIAAFTMPETQMKRKLAGWVTVGVRCLQNISSTSNGTNPMQIAIAGKAKPRSYGIKGDGIKWRWVIASVYLNSTSTQTILLYLDGGTSTGLVMNIDRIVLVKGKLIQDVSL